MNSILRFLVGNLDLDHGKGKLVACNRDAHATAFHARSLVVVANDAGRAPAYRLVILILINLLEDTFFKDGAILFGFIGNRQ